MIGLEWGLLLGMAHMASTSSQPPKGSPQHWVCCWSGAPQLTEPGNMPPSPGFADATIRQTVRLAMSGKRLRLHFSNAFGTAPLTLRAVNAALTTSLGVIDPAALKIVRFEKSSSVTIPAGAEAVSDPIEFPISAPANLAITMYVRDSSSAITGHPGARCTTFFTVGNQMAAAALPQSVQTQHWYYLASIDVEASSQVRSLAIVGDSITDGRGSTTDQNRRWPDVLVERLQNSPNTKSVSVFNQGIGGNRVLNNGLGPSVLSRFDRDVIARPGVKWVILFEGINDLGTHTGASGPASEAQVAQDLIAAFDQLIERCHDNHLVIYGATITPCGDSFYYSDELEAARQTINRWIRTSHRFDGFIDFDEAVRDPSKPTKLQAEYDSGDHLHLCDEGYRRLAVSVPLQLFSR